jgi:hypothetical protein
MSNFLQHRLKLLDDIDCTELKAMSDLRHSFSVIPLNQHGRHCEVRFTPKVYDAFGGTIYLVEFLETNKIFVVNYNKEYIGTLRPCTQSAIKIFVEVFCNDAPSDRCAKSTLSALFA